MSACPTCKSAQQTSQVLVHIDGVTYIQVVSRDNRERDLQACVNYLIGLIEMERSKPKGQSHG